jgi:hypothetical protein
MENKFITQRELQVHTFSNGNVLADDGSLGGSLEVLVIKD